jgi:uncharacterized protein (TIGR02271 family)
MATGFKDQVREGMDVFDSEDQKIGTVSETAEGYLRVPTGFLDLGTEHAIPFSAIRDVTDHEIHLSVPKDRLDELTSASMDTDADHDDSNLERKTTTTTAAYETPSRPDVDERDQTLELREEELTARKQSVETGHVAIGTEVVSEQRTIDVPVTHEEVTIERHAVERRPSDVPIDERGETISIPVHEEQVTAEKRAVVYEEVEVGKRAVQETQHISETVKREEVVIDEEGRVNIEGDSEKPQPQRRS